MLNKLFAFKALLYRGFLSNISKGIVYCKTSNVLLT